MKELKIVDPSIIEDIVCEDVKLSEFEYMKELGEQLIEICIENGGVGLSAPQVGIFKKMFIWMNGNDTYQIVINPKYYYADKKTSNLVEGCLSYPDRNFFTTRYKYINASYDVLVNGEIKRIYRKLSGEKAFIFQHETDHTCGQTIKMIGQELFT